jgi:hypothetical protein
MIIVFEDPLVPEGVEVLVEPDEVAPLVELVGIILTASADVIQLPFEVVMTFALPPKLNVPNLFHLPPFCC